MLCGGHGSMASCQDSHNQVEHQYEFYVQGAYMTHKSRVAWRLHTMCNKKNNTTQNCLLLKERDIHLSHITEWLSDCCRNRKRNDPDKYLLMAFSVI